MSTGLAKPLAPTPRRPATPAGRVARRFARHRLAMAGLGLLVFILFSCLGSLPWALGTADGLPRYDDQNAGPALTPPSEAFLMGTDALGRPLAVRLLYGGAISLAIGLAAAVIAVVLGVTWGAVAGYHGGRVDAIMMRIVDILYGLPYILLVILIKVAAEPVLARWLGSPAVANVVVLLVAIGSVSWLSMARVIRGQVMSLMSQPFVEAARACGASRGRILARHLLVNLSGTVLVYATLIVPQAILQESFLSFLGIGIAAPTPTWGALAANGVAHLNAISMYWWLSFWPCVALGLTLLSLNFIGDGLRDALDPRGEITR